MRASADGLLVHDMRRACAPAVRDRAPVGQPIVTTAIPARPPVTRGGRKRHGLHTSCRRTARAGRSGHPDPNALAPVLATLRARTECRSPSASASRPRVTSRLWSRRCRRGDRGQRMSPASRTLCGLTATSSRISGSARRAGCGPSWRLRGHPGDKPRDGGSNAHSQTVGRKDRRVGQRRSRRFLLGRTAWATVTGRSSPWHEVADRVGNHLEACCCIEGGLRHRDDGHRARDRGRHHAPRQPRPTLPPGAGTRPAARVHVHAGLKGDEH